MPDNLKIMILVIDGLIYPTVFLVVLLKFLCFFAAWYEPYLSSIVNPDQVTGLAAFIMKELARV